MNGFSNSSRLLFAIIVSYLVVNVYVGCQRYVEVGLLITIAKVPFL